MPDVKCFLHLARELLKALSEQSERALTTRMELLKLTHHSLDCNCFLDLPAAKCAASKVYKNKGFQ